MAVYRGEQASYTLFQEVEMSSPMVSLVTTEQDDCANIPFPFCFDKGTYEFNIVLPNTGESYYFVYQRCCKSNTFTNLEQPEEVGFTVSS